MKILKRKRIIFKQIFIGKAILKFYSDIDVNITDCGGQCYDGFANIQSQTKGAASYVLKEFEFIIGLVLLYQLLHPVLGITQNLQVKTFNEVRDCIEDMKHVRENIGNKFHNLQAVRKVSKMA